MHIEPQWFDETMDLFDETYFTLPNQSAVILKLPDHFTSFELTNTEHGTTSAEQYTQLEAVATGISSVTNALVLRSKRPATDQQLIETKKRYCPAEIKLIA